MNSTVRALFFKLTSPEHVEGSRRNLMIIVLDASFDLSTGSGLSASSGLARTQTFSSRESAMLFGG
jgi:hypothetical protein